MIPKRFAATLQRFFKRKAKEAPPSENTTNTTVSGVSPDHFHEGMFPSSSDLSSEREDVYDDMEEIDDVMPEGDRALSVLADNAVNSKEGESASFHIRFDEEPKVPESARVVIEDLLKRTKLQDKIYGVARETLKYGDTFLQPVINKAYNIVRLMYMDPSSMRRNEDERGLLRTGMNAKRDGVFQEKGKAAFEQYEPRSNRLIAAFYSWQIIHLRWARGGKSKYGRPLLFSARYPFKKLQQMEEALVINWLTRAFARLLFKLDVTGMTKKEARAYLESFMKQLTQRTVVAGVSGTSRMTVAKDLAIGNSLTSLGGEWKESLNDVEVLDTSNTGFWNITAIEYWRNKFLSATGVPKAHVGLEEDINAKATLQWQDERFARLVRRVQMLMSWLIRQVIDMELILQGLRPSDINYVIEWPSPSTMDELDKAATYANLAKAADLLTAIGVLSPEYIAQRWFKLTPSELAAVQEQVAANRAKQQAQEATSGTDASET